jgi:hypothetical protein
MTLILFPGLACTGSGNQNLFSPLALTPRVA